MNRRITVLRLTSAINVRANAEIVIQKLGIAPLVLVGIIGLLVIASVRVRVDTFPMLQDIAVIRCHLRHNSQ